MEYNGQGFLEELLAPRNNPWEIPDFYTDGCNYNNIVENPISLTPNSSFEDFSLPFDQSLNSTFSEFYYPFGDEYTDSSNNKFDTTPFPTQEEYSVPNMDNWEAQVPCKMEANQSSGGGTVFNMGACPERKKNKVKKLDGQPSKNLMAERRRRKRLNDRLSMLRSVVPKISKMDRTSILGDTIDYMKELVDRINNLQEGVEVGSNHQLSLMSIFKDVKPNEILVRNSPKFNVERENMNTRIDICCAGKPGLLLSTVTTLEALGLEIQQCVISCFSDFSMQASCSEDLEQRAIISSDDIKQELFRNAGYGGRCL